MANNIDVKEKPKNILGQLVSQGLTPRQDNVLKTVLKFEKTQVEEALQQGVSPENILKQLGIPDSEQKAVQQISSPDNPAELVADERSVSQALAGQPPQPQQTQQGKGSKLLDLLSFAVPGLAVIRSANQAIRGNEQALRGERPNLEQAKETRLIGQEERRIREQKLETLNNRGGFVSQSEINKFNEDLGFDAFSPTIEALGLTAKIDSKTKERSYRIPAIRDLNEIAKRKTVSSKEIEFFQTQFDAADTMQEVLNGLSDLGIQDPAVLAKIGKAIPKDYFEGVGPFSLEARFNTISQFSNPKFNALKQKLERAFQKFRKVITGAQASDKELRTLRPLIASLTSTPEAFFNIANDLISETNRSVDTRLGLMSDIGRDVTKIKERQSKRTKKLGSKAATQQNKQFTSGQSGTLSSGLTFTVE